MTDFDRSARREGMIDEEVTEDEVVNGGRDEDNREEKR